MSHHEIKKEGAFHYAAAVIRYYFSPKLRTVLTVLYFLFFFYLIVFYFGHIFLAIRFIFNTLFSSTISLGPEYMIWGSIFIVCLFLPFLASIVALILPYEMRKRAWPRLTRFVLAGIIAFVTVNFVLFSDFTIGFVEKKPPIKTYLESKGIVVPN